MLQSWYTVKISSICMLSSKRILFWQKRESCHLTIFLEKSHRFGEQDDSFRTSALRIKQYINYYVKYASDLSQISGIEFLDSFKYSKDNFVEDVGMAWSATKQKWFCELENFQYDKMVGIFLIKTIDVANLLLKEEIQRLSLNVKLWSKQKFCVNYFVNFDQQMIIFRKSMFIKSGILGIFLRGRLPKTKYMSKCITDWNPHPHFCMHQRVNSCSGVVWVCCTSRLLNHTILMSSSP